MTAMFFALDLVQTMNAVQASLALGITVGLGLVTLKFNVSRLTLHANKLRQTGFNIAFRCLKDE